MTPGRRLLARHRALAAWLLALALAMKLLVPAGYMMVATPSGPAIASCTGTAPPMAGHAGRHDRRGNDHGGTQMPCAFAGLTAPALAGADPLLLAAAVAFLVAVTFRRATAPVRRGARPHLRPPLRGPPRPA